MFFICFDVVFYLIPGEAKKGTDNDVFNKIMALYSRPFLICVFAEYEKQYGHTFEEAIKKELKGDTRDGMIAICKFVLF